MSIKVIPLRIAKYTQRLHGGYPKIKDFDPSTAGVVLNLAILHYWAGKMDSYSLHVDSI